MKKRIRTLIFIGAAAVLMIAGYFIYKAASAPVKEAEEMVLFEATGIAEISYEYEGETFSFVKEEGAWVYQPDKGYPLNAAYLRDMEYVLLSVTAAEKVEGGSPEEFGLVDPSCVITAVADDGKEFRCELGSDNDTVNIVYARVGGGVYAISDDFSRMFRHTLLEMASKDKLLDAEASEVTSLSLENINGAFSLTQYPGGVPGAYSKNLTWAFSDGAYGDSEEMKKLVRTVADMQPAECVSYEPDDSTFELYGLKDPACTVNIEYNGGALNVLIGRKDQDGRYAVSLPDKGVVYAVDSEAPDALLGYRQQDCLNRYVFLLDYSDIASVKVENGTVSQVIDFADRDAAWDFYYALSNMRAEGFADEALSDGGDVVLTVNMGDTDTVNTLRFARYDENFYSVSFMDDNIKLVNKRDVERLVSLAQGLNNA